MLEVRETPPEEVTTRQQMLHDGQQRVAHLEQENRLLREQVALQTETETKG